MSCRLLAAVLGVAILPAVATAQVSTSALEPVGEPPALSSQTGRQTGVVTYDRADGQQVIIRSYEPRPATTSPYRVDFAALDADGDGYISRAEALAHPTLSAEFDAVDSNRDGHLSREELAGWLR
ncbi:hypothetical protein [Luteimonas sp. TWI1416]|uniref:EF-hand domain-containing protein n=1 Tax=unclassified Luteimonas TaxID=2629088 RepID=UPI00320B73F7